MSVNVTAARNPEATRRILEALPDWFGDPEAVNSYVSETSDEALESFVAAEGEVVVGIALVHRHFPETAELHLIAVDPTAQGAGVGRLLVDTIVAELQADGCAMLTVHTVGPSFEHAGYAATRAFYRALGFIPLEEHEGLDWSGPTLILVRPLRESSGS